MACPTRVPTRCDGAEADTGAADFPHIDKMVLVLDIRGNVMRHRNSFCAMCGRKANMYCGLCERVTYCSERCQLLHWRHHGADCQSYARYAAVPRNLVMYDRRDTGIIAAPVRDALVLDAEQTPDGCTADDETQGRRSLSNLVNLLTSRRRFIPLFQPDFELKTYPLVKTVGRGTYGTVTRRESPDGDDVAIKTIKLGKNGAFSVTFVRETIARNLSHPNVMGLCTAGLSHDAKGAPEELVMVMDVASTDLWDLILAYSNVQKTRGRTGMAIGPEELPYLAYQIVAGLAHCHDNLVAVLDLKPDNVLVRSSEVTVRLIPTESRAVTLKIVDFGLALDFATGDAPPESCGTIGFMAPEIIMRVPGCLRPSADIWSLGCVLFKMATGQQLISSSSLWDAVSIGGGTIADSARRNELFPTWNRDIDNVVPDHFGDRVADKLKEFPLLADLLRGMLTCDYHARLDVHAVAAHPYFADVRKNRDVVELFPMKESGFWAVPGKSGHFSPAYVIDAYDEIVRHEEKMSPADVPSDIDVAANAIAAIVLHIGTNLETSMTSIFRALALLHVMRRTVMHPNAVAETWKRNSAAYAVALLRIACNYRGEYVTTDDIARGLDDVPANIPIDSEDAALKILEALDFNLSRPTPFDYLSAYIELNPGINSTTKRAASCVLLLASAEAAAADGSDAKKSALAALAMSVPVAVSLVDETNKPIIPRKEDAETFRATMRRMQASDADTRLWTHYYQMWRRAISTMLGSTDELLRVFRKLTAK